MQYDFDLSANSTMRLDVAGRFFKYISGTGKIRVRVPSGLFVDLLPGQGVWDALFSALEIIDVSGVANKGTILAGDFDFRDDRIVGDVNILENPPSETDTGRTFFSGASVTNVASAYGSIALFNPAGSGKKVVLDAFSVNSSLATGAVIGSIQGSNQGYFSGVTEPWSKSLGLHSGSGKSSSILRVRTSTTINQYLYRWMMYPYLGAYTFFEFKFTNPIVIPENMGFMFTNGIVNARISMNVEFREYDV